MSDHALLDAAVAVLAYWDELDTIPSDDPHPTAKYATEMERRMDRLRRAIEAERRRRR